MVTVEVCIGSACYVKGSNEVVTILQELIKEKGWEDQVNVKGAFCMQVCTPVSYTHLGKRGRSERGIQ